MAEMTREHKEALAKGRRQAKIVRDYLKGLEQDRGSSQASKESLESRLQDVRERIAEEDDKASRVELHQRKIDLEKQLEELEEGPDLEELERRFVDVVEEYSARKSVSYMAWREEGVPAAVLKDAGLKRSYNPPEGD